MATWRAPELLLLDEHTAALDPRSADQVVRVSEAVIVRERLTALIVTHSMQQAVSLGDRLLMLDRGRILHDLGGAEKSRLRVDDLLARFEDVRRGECLDEGAAEVLRRGYV
jgi:putative ABC transport system ATP-binding protein